MSHKDLASSPIRSNCLLPWFDCEMDDPCVVDSATVEGSSARANAPRSVVMTDDSVKQLGRIATQERAAWREARDALNRALAEQPTLAARASADDEHDPSAATARTAPADVASRRLSCVLISQRASFAVAHKRRARFAAEVEMSSRNDVSQRRGLAP